MYISISSNSLTSSFYAFQPDFISSVQSLQAHFRRNNIIMLNFVFLPAVYCSGQILFTLLLSLKFNLRHANLFICLLEFSIYSNPSLSTQYFAARQHHSSSNTTSLSRVCFLFIAVSPPLYISIINFLFRVLVHHPPRKLWPHFAGVFIFLDLHTRTYIPFDLPLFNIYLFLFLSMFFVFVFAVRKDLELRLQFRFFNNLHRKSTRIQ